MSRWVVVSCLFLSACTKANPAVSCTDGSCSDPAFPFCDSTGAFGDPGTCVSVSCTPGTFAACAGSDVELRCSATGASYDQIQCANGCDPVADGCRVCEASQTVCADGKVQTCDANGAVVSTQECALGCFEDQPRCIDIDPSNGLATYLDMVAAPPDLHISVSTTGMTATLNTTTGDITVDGQTLSVPSFLAPAGSGESPIRVYVVHDLVVDDKLDISSGTSDGHGPAIAFVATGDITVNAPLVLLDGGLASCAAGNGADSAQMPDYAGGGGGGGNATSGGSGGNVINTGFHGGTGGAIHGTPQLEPLVGGCDAGGINAASSYAGVTGGGVIQLSGRAQIAINSRIDARGGKGRSDMIQNINGAFDDIMTGGGGGGGILIEAPRVALHSGAELDASGGDGASFCTVATAQCGLGGVGATSATIAGANGTTVTVTDGTNSYFAGGGGGGLGRLRINTPNAVDLSVPSIKADISTGALRTR